MANSLKIDLTDQTVVIAAKYHIPTYRALEHRVFRVTGGFGASPNTSGSALFGQYLLDGEECRLEGRMVERLATEADLAAVEEARA